MYMQIASRPEALILRSTEPKDLDALCQGAELAGLRPCRVDTSWDAVRVVATNPVVAMFPLMAEPVNGMRIERALRHSNASVSLVAFGPSLRSSEVCRLLAAGVATYLDPPLSPEHIAFELESLRATNRLEEAIRAAVGVQDLKGVQRLVRHIMCTEALGRARGSKRGAARLLGVDRRAVQKLVEQMEDEANPKDDLYADVSEACSLQVL